MKVLTYLVSISRDGVSSASVLLKVHACHGSDLERYRQFFGIVSDRELKDEADALKAKGDFTSPDSFKASMIGNVQGPGGNLGSGRDWQMRFRDVTQDH